MYTSYICVRLRRLTRVAPGLAAITLCLLNISTLVEAQGGAHTAAPMTDGREILQKSFSTYQQMTGYSGRSNTDSILMDVNGHELKQIGTAVEMKYKRPNKLRLDFVTPIGSRVVWSNAKGLGLYDPSTQKYSIVPTAPNLESMLPLLFKEASISAAFDPLYGLSRGKLPAQLVHINLKAQSTYNGHPVYVVTGDLQGKRVGEWTWWIDQRTFLLYKIEQITRNIEQTVISTRNGQKVTSKRKVNLVLRIVVTEARPNADISDGDFDFKPPAGATIRITPPDTGNKH